LYTCRGPQEIYDVFFPEETLTERVLLLKVAGELETPIEILEELNTTTTPLLLASESSGSNRSRWSLDEMLVVREAFVKGQSDFLPITKQMNETEAKLFWSSVVGKMPFTRRRFLNVMASKKDLSPEVIHNSEKFLSDKEILDAIENDIEKLYDPQEWWRKPNAALRKRWYRRWSKHKPHEGLIDFNGGVFQLIPGGKVDLQYFSSSSPYLKDWAYDDMVVERVGTVVTDVAYPDYPQLGLRGRLHRYAESHEDPIAWPEQVKSWEALVKSDGMIRFPDTGPFVPSSMNGYILDREGHKHYLRLDGVKNDDGQITISFSALDGVEFIPVGFCELHILSEQNSVLYDVRRRVGEIEKDEKNWRIIPEDECIVIGVSSPFVDRRMGVLSSPTFISVENEMGISDVTQYVDLVGVDNG
tara:strand:+ start:1147 stop:2391 length:1245 start_codon:yes stop_codon:yes gene_type:complete